MPELPEVETVARGLQRLVGLPVVGVRVQRTDLRSPIAVAEMKGLVGRSVVEVGRRGKVLWWRLQGGGEEVFLRVHLGMSGRLWVGGREMGWEHHEHLRWDFPEFSVRLYDPRRFGWVDVVGVEEFEGWRSQMAPEPWDERVTPQQALTAARGRRGSVKGWLLAGEWVVGIGNIYACEILFAAGVAPGRAVGSLSLGEWERVITAMREVLERAIAAGGTTVRDFTSVEAQEGWFQVQLAVYGRAGKPCTRCGGEVRRVRQGGRTTWWCPGCQR
ncbi:MAG: bifunctional DNA-formamidopyrimidine glycosylase/DNA-(apurinic or apyrimidinic site) lyase [Hydrogenophilus sp.]|nr:bifunctional DNA-formamidopyrimidine glycosylase/DNA-(apurinic or apyrimidinic site) lyase [Hydrogenophilus sp.]